MFGSLVGDQGAACGAPISIKLPDGHALIAYSSNGSAARCRDSRSRRAGKVVCCEIAS
jgi:hypothetical protein